MKQPPSKKPAPAKVSAKAQEPNKLVDEVPTHPPETVDDVEEAPVEPTPVVPAPKEEDPLVKALEQVDKEKLLGFIESIIGTLTFRTVSLVALLIAVGLVLFALYENRTQIVTKFTQPKATISESQAAPPAWILSEGSKQSLISLAKATNVGMIVLSDVDLKKNRRNVRYYYIDDPTVKLEPPVLQALALPLPVFDYDAKNTEQMIAVLSNDFRCDKYQDTVYFRFAPELADKFPTICRLAVPPFVGTFVGFITVGVTGEVGNTNLETIRLEVSRIAVEIYMNDVTKKSSPGQK